jgi:hypothetical protein
MPIMATPPLFRKIRRETLIVVLLQAANRHRLL